jgi:hypothetical protein
MPREPIRAPLGVNVPGFAMAGFQVTLHGRIWVTAEVDRCWNAKCNLLKWVLVDAPTGWLDLGRNFMNWISGQ